MLADGAAMVWDAHDATGRQRIAGPNPRRTILICWTVNDAMNRNRRTFLQTAGALTAATGLSSRGWGQFSLPRDGTVRDRIWIFANPMNADYNFVRKRSVM